MIWSNKVIHRRFKLNGVSYTYLKLIEEASRLYKEGENYEISIGEFLLELLKDTATITVSTSGSTGKPKATIVEKQFMVNSALATGNFFNLSAGSTALHCLPSDFIAGKMMLVRALVLGLELYCIAPTTKILDKDSRCYDFAAMLPMQLEASLQYINYIKKLIVGGVSISNNLKRKIQNKTTKIFETYGMTETLTHIAVKPINHIYDSCNTSILRAVDKERFIKPSNVFRVLPDVAMSIDERGCLIINAPKVSRELVVTNDLVRMLSDKEFEWLGRYDNIINSGGVKLIPEEIEAKLIPLFDLRYFVAGLPDGRLGQKVVLIIEGTINLKQLIGKITALRTIHKFQIPKEIHCVSKFIETNGKVHRNRTIGLIKG